MVLAKIVKQHIPVTLPSYLQPFQGHSRLRNSHMDSLCFETSILPRASSNAFAKNFFFRTHTKWNHIPLAIREIESIKEFKNKLSTYMWDKILPGEFDYDPDYSLDTDLWSGLPQINNLHIRAWLSLLSVFFTSLHITSWMGTVFTLLYDFIVSYSFQKWNQWGSYPH